MIIDKINHWFIRLVKLFNQHMGESWLCEKDFPQPEDLGCYGGSTECILLYILTTNLNRTLVHMWRIVVPILACCFIKK